MDKRDNRITRTSGMTAWRARCGESRTSGSEGGPQKPADRKDGQAPRSDPYTEHPTREGKIYCAVVLDVFSRRVVGSSIDSRPPKRSTSTYARSNKPVLRPPVESGQFTSIRYSERLAEIGAAPSVGSVGDSFDNALAETVIGLYKTELIRGPNQGPWDSATDVELATLGWVHWHNSQRLHTHLGDVPPTEFEAAYAARRPDHQTVGNQ